MAVEKNGRIQFGANVNLGELSKNEILTKSVRATYEHFLFVTTTADWQLNAETTSPITLLP
jgi:hypothetical protein